MKGDIPVFTRCCFCLPLRYGLLVWGYFKLAADALIITSLSMSMMTVIMTIKVSRSDDDFYSRIRQDMVLPVIALAIFIADFMMTIVFLVGGHKKNARLIRVFYYISIMMWIFTLMLTTLSVVLLLEDYSSNTFWERFLLTLSFYLVALVIQTYFILLLISEITKLKNIGGLNNAVEAECTMNFKDGIVDEEKETEDVCSKRTLETKDGSNGTCHKNDDIAPREKTDTEVV